MKALKVILTSIVLQFLIITFCYSQKTKLGKGSTLFSTSTVPAGGTSQRVVEKFKLKSNIKINQKVTEKDDHAILSRNILSTPAINIDTTQIDTTSFLGRIDYPSKYTGSSSTVLYFPYPSQNGKLIIRKTNSFFKKWSWSTVTISARSRNAVNTDSQDYIDEEGLTAPEKTWEAKFSPGLAFTNEIFKRTTYDQDFGKREMNLKFGPVFSIGVQDIKSETTLGRSEISRKALTWTLGGIASVGINDIDFGVFGGWDLATGKDSKYWIYQGKFHTGFILGYQLVKDK